MEDFFETRISDVDGQMVAFFAVFDGHGGARTAEYLKNNIFNNLVNHDEFISDTKKAIGMYVCLFPFLCFLPEGFGFGRASV